MTGLIGAIGTGTQPPVQGDPPTSAEPVAAEQVPVERVQAELTRDEMDALLAVGQAEHLAQHVTDFITWQASWWTVATDGVWIRIDDAELHATLDRYQRRMKAGLFG